MTDDDSRRTNAGITRRQVLAASSASALVGVAGCSGDGPCPDVEHDLNTGYDQSSDSVITWGEDDDDWQLLTDPTNAGPVPRPATVSGAPQYFSYDGSPISLSEAQGNLGPDDDYEFVYQYCFCLHPDFENPELELKAHTYDDFADLRLNGTSLSYSLTGGSSLGSLVEETYTDTGLFEEGVNCFDVVIKHAGGYNTNLDLAGAVTAENGDCDCDPGECAPTLSKDTAGPFDYGEQATYSYQICNDGDGECTDELEVEDDLPDGISFVSASGNWTGTASGSVVTATNNSYGGLDPGECLTLDLVVQVAPENQFPGDPPHETENCATLLQSGDVVDEGCVTHDITCPAVAFDLNSGFDQDSGTALGDGVDDDDWTIVEDTDAPGSVPKQATVVNQSAAPGNWPAPFQDSRWISHDASALNELGATYEYEYCFCLRDGFSDPELDLRIRADNTVVDIRLNGTSLAFDGDGEFTGDPIEETYTDPDRFQAGDNCLTLVLENEYWEAGLNIAGTMAADDADCDCGAGGEPACEFTFQKDTQGPFHYGQQETYVFEVCNDGNGECTGPLTVEDDLPSGISFDSVSGNWTPDTSGPVLELGNTSYGGLAPGECLTFEVTVDVGPGGELPAEVENCARLSHDGDLVTEDCVSHPLSHGDCELSFSKDAAGEFHYGREGTYVFEVCNDGEEVCTGPLTIEDELPDGIVLNSVTGNWNTNVSGGVVELTNNSYGGLAPGDCLTFEMTVDVESASTFPGDPPVEAQNCANLSHDGDFVTEDCVTHDITEHPCDLSLRKDVGWEFHYDQPASYVFEVCNDSEAECTGPLTVEDDLPDGVSFVSVDTGWTTNISGGVVELTNDSYGGLAPGDCLTLEMTVDVAPASDFPGEPPHSITNCAELSLAGNVEAEDCATTRITLTRECPPVEHIISTGYDQASGQPLNPLDPDDDWDVVSDGVSFGPTPRDADVTPDVRWPDPFQDSQWISFEPDKGLDQLDDTDQVFEYEYCFCLNNGFTNPELQLRAWADDEITAVELNGQSLTYSGDGSVGNGPVDETYTDLSLFQAGDNCLTITVTDTDGVVSGLNVAGRARAENGDCNCKD